MKVDDAQLMELELGSLFSHAEGTCRSQLKFWQERRATALSGVVGSLVAGASGSRNLDSPKGDADFPEMLETAEMIL